MHPRRRRPIGDAGGHLRDTDAHTPARNVVGSQDRAPHSSPAVLESSAAPFRGRPRSFLCAPSSRAQTRRRIYDKAGDPRDGARQGQAKRMQVPARWCAPVRPRSRRSIGGSATDWRAAPARGPRRSCSSWEPAPRRPAVLLRRLNGRPRTECLGRYVDAVSACGDQIAGESRCRYEASWVLGLRDVGFESADGGGSIMRATCRKRATCDRTEENRTRPCALALRRPHVMGMQTLLLMSSKFVTFFEVRYVKAGETVRCFSGKLMLESKGRFASAITESAVAFGTALRQANRAVHRPGRRSDRTGTSPRRGSRSPGRSCNRSQVGDGVLT